MPSLVCLGRRALTLKWKVLFFIFFGFVYIFRFSRFADRPRAACCLNESMVSLIGIVTSAWRHNGFTNSRKNNRKFTKNGVETCAHDFFHHLAYKIFPCCRNTQSVQQLGHTKFVMIYQKVARGKFARSKTLLSHTNSGNISEPLYKGNVCAYASMFGFFTPLDGA